MAELLPTSTGRAQLDALRTYEEHAAKGARCAVAADLDGDLDLVSSEWSTLAQFRSENDGAGRFTGPRPSAPAFQANGYVTGFLDIAPRVVD